MGKVRNKRLERYQEMTEATELESKHPDYNSAHKAWKRAGKGESPGAIDVINWWRKKKGKEPVKDPNTERRAKVKEYLKNNPNASNKEMSEGLGVSESTLKRDMSSLTDSGDIRHITSDAKQSDKGNFYKTRKTITDPIYTDKTSGANYKGNKWIPNSDDKWMPEGGRKGEPLVKNPDYKPRKLTPTEIENRKKRTVNLPKEGKTLAKQTGAKAKKKLLDSWMKGSNKSPYFPTQGDFNG